MSSGVAVEIREVAGDDGDVVVVNAQREETMNAMWSLVAFVLSRLVCVTIPGVCLGGLFLRAQTAVVSTGTSRWLCGLRSMAA